MHGLIVTEVRLVGKDGTALIREAQAQNSVILLTAYKSVPQAAAAIKSRASEYMVRPVLP
jgi:DNA-binding NtrC family response regulator